MKAGDAPVALIIPQRIRAASDGVRADASGSAIELLNDQSDTIAPQMVMGLLQKAAMTAMPAAMAEEGMKYTEQVHWRVYAGAAKAKMDEELDSAASRIERAGRSERGERRTPTADRGDYRGERARRGGREQEEPDDLVLCGGDRRDVSAVHGERLGGGAAGRGRERHAGARAEHARDHDEAAGGKAGVQHRCWRLCNWW